MRRCSMLVAAAVVLATAAAQPALGALPDGAAGPWADSVVSFNQGSVNPGGFLPGRSDPTAALGPAEAPAGNDPSPVPGTFVSLGFRGSLTLGFDNPICNGTGADLAIEVREITRDPPGGPPYPLERVEVYASEDGVTFHFAGTVTRDDSVGMPAAISVANFVRLVDINNQADFAFDPNADGFDVDGVKALNTTCPTGKLEICKSGANGQYSKPFQFSLNGGTPFTVRGGRCTGPITTRPGLNTIEESPTVPPTDVSAIAVRPSARLIAEDLPNRKVSVKVVTGSTAASETKVTFTNEPGGGATGELKICKVTNTPSLLGKMFSFRVNGGPLISTEAGPEPVPALWSCRPAGTFQTGSRVTVQEIIPAGTVVDYIDTDPADRLVSHNRDTGTAVVEIGGGQNIVIFDNEAVPPAQSGYIEICKDAARTGPNYTPDPEVTGLFTFTVAPPEGNPFQVSTYAGQCTAPLQVAAGVVRVTEHARTGFTLVDVYTIPDTALLFDNLINRTADVEVPVADNPIYESQVHFVNARDRAQLKVCKELGPNSSVLAGETFNFDVVDLDASPSRPLSVSVLAPGCKVVGDYPVGHRVQVTEQDPGPYISRSGEGTSTIQPGINTVTITNTAQGLLRICKATVPGITNQPTFRFRIDGTGPYIPVKGGACSPAMPVSVGDHTVTESMEADYELDPNGPGMGITATPPSREQSKNLGTRSITVSVPYADDGETRVDYTNRIRRGDIIICKSRDSTPAGPYDYDVWVDGQGVPYAVLGVTVGGCSAPSGPFPVLRADGERTQVEVIERAGPYVVTSITCPACRPASNSPPAPVTNPDVTLRYTRFSLAPGTNTVTYTNRAVR